MKKVLLTLLVFLSIFSLFGQEIKIIDNTGNGDFQTIGEAVDYINALTEIPTGGIEINLTAGQTFTEDFASITAQGTETSPIIFQQYGEGEKPVIMSETEDHKVFFAEAAAYLRFYNLKVADPDPTNDLHYHTAFDMDDVNNVIIENCIAENFGKYGIYSHGATLDAVYNSNKTYYTEEYFTDQTTVTGIKSSYNSQAGHATISNNQIYGFKTATSTVYGIDFNQVDGEVINNTISITADGNDKIFGIRVVGRAGLTHKIYNNSVYLAGTSTDEGYALATAGGGGTLIVKNNIFQNSRPEDNQYCVNIMFPFIGLEFDNNIYYNNETTPFRAKRQSEIYTDLSAWITTEEQDANSKISNIEFENTTNGDLHIAETSLGNQDLIAIPLTEVPTDIDGETRHTEFPYCGADENIEVPLVNNMGGEYVIDNTGNGDFSSIAEAVTQLNRAQIENGGITFNIVAGQTFTDSIPTLMAVGTETSPIIFQKNGEGENPIIDYNYFEGSVFSFENSAFITLDGLTITDTNNDAIQYEKAIYINASTNITIQNCEFVNFAKYGTHVRNASVNTTIENNEYYHTPEYDTEESSIYGIYVQFNADADNAIIRKNKIYGLKQASAGVYGIRVQKVNSTITNNFISIADDNNDKLYGIRCDAGTDGLVMDIFYNTVYLAGVATDADYCFYRTGTDGLVNLQNNVFVNERTGDFEHAIFDYTFVAGDWTANYNTYYCENGVIGNWGETVCTTLEEWQIASSADASSNTVNVEFESATDLHLAGTSLLDYDLAGFPIDNITTDIDGDTRHAVNPYKGADENTEYPLDPENQYAIEVNPLNLDFGTIYNSTISDSMTVMLANIGAENLTISEIQIDGPFEFRTETSVWETTIPSFDIPTTESTNVYVRFIPESAVTSNNTMIIQSNAANNPSISVDLTAISVDAGITMTATEIEFPHTVAETEMIDSFIIYNNNEIALTIDSITLAEPFSFQIGENDFVNSLENIEIQDSILVNVKYLPLEVADNSETLTITSNLLSDETIAISGSSYESSFTQVTPFMSGIWVGDSQVGDYDNDGDLDILTSGYGIPSGTSHINLYRNNGNDEYETIETDMEGVGNGCLYWVDVDNDNDLDIYLSGQYQSDDDRNHLYINNGGEYSDLTTNLPILMGSTIDWKDYNGDGLLDALIIGAQEIPDEEDIEITDIYLNEGDGQFQPLNLDIIKMLNGEAKFSDFNNDGLLDIAYTGRVGSWDYRSYVAKNLGNNTFEQIELEGEGIRDGSLKVGDYDNDGDMDIFITGTFDQGVPSETHIYRNDGNDSFVNINADNSLVGVRRGQLAIGDMDNDGDLDFMVNGVTSEHYWAGSVYFNAGNDRFVEADSLVALKYGEFSLGDMDGDLDLDVVLTGRFASEIYISALFKNEAAFQNTAPEAPMNLLSTINEDEISLTWDAATDEQTPSQSLTYNLKIGTTSGGNEILSGQAMEDGTRLISGVGNMITSLGASINGLPNGTYYASVQAVDHSFIGSSFSEEIIIEITNSTGNELEINPIVTNLKGNYPNPFNPVTSINFSVKEDQNVTIEIFNVRGQKIKTLTNNSYSQGNHQVIWQGTNDAGSNVSSGIYFYKMKTKEYTKTRKMMLLK